MLEQLAIQIETDRHDVAALCGTENAARTPNLQVAHGDAKTCAQRAVLLDRADPFARGANCHHLTRKKEICIRFVLGPSDASAQLIEIGETKSVCTIDDDGIGVRNIEPALDDRRANEYVDVPADESRHDGLEFVRIHLAMPDLNPCLRTKIDNTIPRAADRLDAVMQEENLTLPLEFAIDRVANEPLIVPGHDRFHRQAIQWRGLNRGHVFYADERKVKRARDWRGGQRQDVDEFEELFEFFFVQNAEALLLVDHDEAEIFEDNIAGDQPVRSDHNIDTAFAQQLQDFLLFGL